MNLTKVENDVRFLMSEIRKLRARLALVPTATTTAAAVASLPVVDFFVDRFDRANSDSLGTYWLDGRTSTDANWQANGSQMAFVLRSGTVLPYSGGGVTLVPTFTVQSSTSTQVFVDQPYQFNLKGLVYSPSALYKARMTTPGELNAKITFTAPPAAATGFGYPTTFGLSLAVSNVPGYSVVGRAANHEALADPALAAGTFTDVQAGINSIYSPVIFGHAYHSGTGVYDSNNYSAAAPAGRALVNTSLSSSNTLQIAVSAGTTTVSLNGTPLYSGSQPSASGASKVALIAYAIDVLTDMTANAHAAHGITSIKVWKNTMAEPPDESGHGLTSDTGVALRYSDKYHTPVYVGTTLTGYTYNPSA